MHGTRNKHRPPPLLLRHDAVITNENQIRLEVMEGEQKKAHFVPFKNEEVELSRKL